MNDVSIEERLHRARGLSALLVTLADQAAALPDNAPPPAFWAGLGDVAETIEQHVAAVQTALDVEGQTLAAPDVFVER